jgi:pyruvate/2-oxoglutarate dehydrogenase complex dihydrolipoamide acyltransferase (E2) component
MADVPVRIPKVSMAIEEATLLQWLVPDAEKVGEGESLYVLETEKVETEISAPAGGVVHWTAELGQTYEVGTQIGYIETGD